MGEHRLKGLLLTAHLWQVIAPDLQQDFAPLPSLNTTPNNLPIQVTSFVGQARRRWRRLKTYSPLRPASPIPSGPGCGYSLSRVPAAVARRASHSRSRSRCWKLLTTACGSWNSRPLADPAFVPQAVASVLGLQEQAGRPWVEHPERSPARKAFAARPRQLRTLD